MLIFDGLFGIRWKPCSCTSEKTLYGEYFTISKGIIICIPDDLIVCGRDIINGKGMVSGGNDLGEFQLLKVLGLRPAPFLIYRYGNMVVVVGAGEGKSICQLAGSHVPVFFLIPPKVGFDGRFRVLSPGDYGQAEAKNGKGKQFHKRFMVRQSGDVNPYIIRKFFYKNGRMLYQKRSFFSQKNV
jgi:hypothetical protein